MKRFGFLAAGLCLMGLIAISSRRSSTDASIPTQSAADASIPTQSATSEIRVENQDTQQDQNPAVDLKPVPNSPYPTTEPGRELETGPTHRPTVVTPTRKPHSEDEIPPQKRSNERMTEDKD